MNRPCRCGHIRDSHFRAHSSLATEACYYCGCEKFRPIEEPDTEKTTVLPRITPPTRTLVGKCPCGREIYAEEPHVV